MNNSHFVSRIRWSRYTTRKRHNASMVSHMELTHRATSHKYIRKEGQLCGLLLLFWLHHHCCNCSSWHLLMALHFLMASHPCNNKQEFSDPSVPQQTGCLFNRLLEAAQV